ncbi:MAG: serine O-acetyltransferase [Clostridia bacterium]|nr:serine O-acetyltransferase [Clostridia bacterium]
MSFIKTLNEEITLVFERDPAARSKWQVLLLYPGVRAILSYRLAHKLHNKGHYFLADWISKRARRKTGIEIHPAAQIGKGLFIDHGMGVVIGETTIIGENCTLYQGVTLGGTGKDKGKRHPTIGNNVTIGSGAKVLGPFTVGDNSKIAANAVVLNEIPPNSTCVGVPAHIVKRENVNVAPAKIDLDQIHIPDPVSMDLCKLRVEIEKIKAQLEKGENQNESL